MEEMQKDCQEQSLPCSRATGCGAKPDRTKCAFEKKVNGRQCIIWDNEP
jgi:hypothetical protein